MQYLSTRVPGTILLQAAALILLFMGLLVWGLFADITPYQRADADKFLLIGGSMLAAAMLFQVFLSLGYKIGYDETSLYWKKAGLSRDFAAGVSIPFPSITDVSAVGGGLLAFEAVILHAGGHDVEDIILSRLYLADFDINDVLKLVAERSTAQFDPAVVEFMESM